MSNPFLGLSSGDLSTLKTAYLAAATAVASNQAYSLNGRSLTRASLPEITRALGQIQAALDCANDLTSNTTYVSFTGN